MSTMPDDTPIDDEPEPEDETGADLSRLDDAPDNEVSIETTTNHDTE